MKHEWKANTLFLPLKKPCFSLFHIPSLLFNFHPKSIATLRLFLSSLVLVHRTKQSSLHHHHQFILQSMEMSLRLQDTETPPSMNSSPRSSNLRNPSNNTNTTPKSFPRSDCTPYPTTFVQADTSTFKQVVQMLTGSSDSTNPQDPPPPQPSKNFNIPPIKTTPNKQQGFKLYERRNNNNNNLKNNLIINTLVPNFPHISGFSSPHKPEILSPSFLNFPSLTLSPVTPLNDYDPFNKSSPSLASSTSSDEDKAIAEKGFYLHPSPMSTPREFEPQLLPLFPVSSPTVSELPWEKKIKPD